MPKKLYTISLVTIFSLSFGSVAYAVPNIPSPSATSSTGSIDNDNNVLDTELSHLENMRKAEEARAKAEKLALDLAKATSNYELAEIALHNKETELKKLQEKIKIKTIEVQKFQKIIDGYAVDAYMNQGSPLSPVMGSILSGENLSDISSYEIYVEKSIEEKKARSEDALNETRELKKLQAQATANYDAIVAEKKKLQEKRDFIAGKLIEVRALHNESTRNKPALVLAQESKKEKDLNESGIALWSNYRQSLIKSGVDTASADLLNNPSAWPKNWITVIGPSGEKQLGIAQVINPKTKKLITVIPYETVEGIQVGLATIGTPYSWGGGTPNGPSYGIERGANTIGYDCSGLMVRIWGSQGADIVSHSRVAAAQQTYFHEVKNEDIVPGDMVYFGVPAHHVAIYLGNGKMLEAPYTGALVKVSPLRRFDSATRATIGNKLNFKVKNITIKKSTNRLNSIKKQDKKENLVSINNSSIHTNKPVGIYLPTEL